MFKGFSRRAVLVAGATLALPHIARAAVQTLRLGHNNTDNSHYGQGATAFAAAVAADPVLSGSIRLAVHGNAALGDELGMLKAVSSGTLDMMFCAGSVTSNLVPAVGVLNAPFLFRDVEAARAALDGSVGRELAGLFKAKDMRLLTWGENGLRHVTSNRPIRTPGDLKGLKIRTPQAEVILDGFRFLGASAETLSFNLLREALRTGQFEAQENPIIVLEASRLFELQSHLSLTGHSYDPIAVIASSDVMEDMKPDQLAALTSCAQKGAAVTRSVAAAAQQDGIARLRGLGMTVIDDVDRSAFAAASRPYLEGLGAKHGAGLVARLISATV